MPIYVIPADPTARFFRRVSYYFLLENILITPRAGLGVSNKRLLTCRDGSGGFPYGSPLHSSYDQAYDHNEQEYGSELLHYQHDYLLKRKKRDVINSRQGFLADDGYQSYQADYGYAQ